MRYIVITRHENSAFNNSTEFDDLLEACKFCDSEREKIGGDVHIYEMDQPIPGAWVASDRVVPHQTGAQ